MATSLVLSGRLGSIVACKLPVTSGYQAFLYFELAAAYTVAASASSSKLQPIAVAPWLVVKVVSYSWGLLPACKKAVLLLPLFTISSSPYLVNPSFFIAYFALHCPELA